MRSITIREASGGFIITVYESVDTQSGMPDVGASLKLGVPANVREIVTMYKIELEEKLKEIIRAW